MQEKSFTPLERGLKAVGVGKRGSRDIDPALVEELMLFLQKPADPLQLGAFVGALLAKGPAEDERKLEALFGPGSFADPRLLIPALCPDAPLEIQEICVRLLRGELLSGIAAQTFADFLFSDAPGEGARGIGASVLRVRYESPEELDALLKAVVNQVPRWKTTTGVPVVQIAEPFDGSENAWMMTPLLARALRQRGFRVLQVVGRSSGPKFSVTGIDLARALGIPFSQSGENLDADPWGAVVDQKALSSSLDRWVDRRHRLLKRPFLAAMEKIVNPARADILIASAFHGPYLEKMSDFAAKAGFKGSIIVRKGLEGTIAFSLSKPVEVLVQGNVDNRTVRQLLSFEPALVGAAIQEDGRMSSVDTAQNAELLSRFVSEGSTGDARFDLRIHYTIKGIESALATLSESGAFTNPTAAPVPGENR